MHKLALLFLLLSLPALAQKSTVKEADAGILQVLQIDVDNIYRLDVKTTNGDTFKASMNTEGEFSTEMVLNLIENGSTWLLNVGFAPGFEPNDDKLGAHKIVSVDLTLEIPQGKYLMVSGRCLRVSLDGVYDKTEVILDAGNIAARNFKASGILSTNEGSIKVYAQDDVAAIVDGSPERVINELETPATNYLKVRTAKGSVKLRKAKN